MSTKDRSYQDVKDELDAVMTWFEHDDVDLDEAVQKYQQGMQLVQQLEAHLKQAENKVIKLKQKFSE